MARKSSKRRKVRKAVSQRVALVTRGMVNLASMTRNEVRLAMRGVEAWVSRRLPDPIPNDALLCYAKRAPAGWASV